MRGRVAMLTVTAWVLALTAPAAAETFCAPASTPGCTTASAAFAAAAANPGPDRIELGALSEPGTFTDAPGEPVDVVGAGVSATRLEAPAAPGAPTLALRDDGSSVRALTVRGGAGGEAIALELAGSARDVRLEARGGLALLAGAGSPRLEGATLLLDGARGIEARCDSALVARHVTVVGSGTSAARADCDSASVAFNSSIVRLPVGPRVSAAWSNVAGGSAGPGNVDADPGFVSAAGALGPGSPMIDAGGPPRSLRESLPRTPRASSAPSTAI